VAVRFFFVGDAMVDWRIVVSRCSSSATGKGLRRHKEERGSGWLVCPQSVHSCLLWTLVDQILDIKFVAGHWLGGFGLWAPPLAAKCFFAAAAAAAPACTSNGVDVFDGHGKGRAVLLAQRNVCTAVTECKILAAIDECHHDKDSRQS
jgi:hypothetical protein